MINEDKVAKLIGKIFEEHPDISIRETIESFSNFLAFTQVKSDNEKLFSILMESYCKYLIYYSLREEPKKK